MTRTELMQRKGIAPPPAAPVYQQFRSLGEQLLAIRQAQLAPNLMDVRLSEINTRGALGSNEKFPSEGGFLVSPEFVPALVARMYQTGEILSRCEEMPILKSGANAIKFPQFAETSRANGSRLGGVTVYYADEAAAATASRPKFQLSELRPQRVIGLIYLTAELAADAAALETFTLRAFGQEMAFSLENNIISGSGAGRPLGVLNSGALIKVAKEAGQAAGTVVVQNVVKAISRLWAPSKKTAIWLCNQELLPQLYTLSLPVGTGGSQLELFEFAKGIDSPWDRLAGIPIIPVEYCPMAGAVGDLILADFSRYVISTKGPMMADVSIHVSFLTDENAMRFVMRVDGQPIDATPVTPLNGTNTTSPFVAIDVR
jgi:HK97 family phage major capsid protein